MREGQEWVCVKYDVSTLLRRESFGDHVTNEEESGWGVPPFAFLWNNEYFASDIDGVVPKIDAYDLLQSDFANTVEDFDIPLWVIKNYDGTNLQEFMRDVKANRAIKVSDDGDARRETPTVQHEAKTVILDRLKKEIFEDSMGVMFDNHSGNMTTVEIRAMYKNLDLKADAFEAEVIRFLSEVAAFYLLGVNVSQEKLMDSEIVVSFTRDALENFVELATLANMSMGAVSDETRWTHDPRVGDPQEEAKLAQPYQESEIE
jgi:SPP1 family phage portal protein